MHPKESKQTEEVIGAVRMTEHVDHEIIHEAETSDRGIIDREETDAPQIVDAVRNKTGRRVSVAVSHRRADDATFVSLRVTDEDGAPITIRLGRRNARRLADALEDAAERLPFTAAEQARWDRKQRNWTEKRERANVEAADPGTMET